MSEGNPLHYSAADLGDRLPEEPKTELGYARRLVDVYGDGGPARPASA